MRKVALCLSSNLRNRKEYEVAVREAAELEAVELIVLDVAAGWSEVERVVQQGVTHLITDYGVPRWNQMNWLNDQGVVTIMIHGCASDPLRRALRIEPTREDSCYQYRRIEMALCCNQNAAGLVARAIREEISFLFRGKDREVLVADMEAELLKVRLRHQRLLDIYDAAVRQAQPR